MLIDRGLDLGRSAKAARDTGKQRLDDLVAQDEVGAHGPNAGRIGLVAARPLDAVEALQIFPRMPGPLPRWLTRCAYPFLPLSHRPSP
jgi:hypothetical protein